MKWIKWIETGHIVENFDMCMEYAKRIGIDVDKHDLKKVYDDIVQKVGDDEEEILRHFIMNCGPGSIDG